MMPKETGVSRKILSGVSSTDGISSKSLKACCSPKMLKCLGRKSVLDCKITSENLHDLIRAISLVNQILDSVVCKNNKGL